MQNKNKTQSQPQLYLKKNITFIHLLVSIHTESSSGLRTKPLKRAFHQARCAVL